MIVASTSVLAEVVINGNTFIIDIFDGRNNRTF